MYRLERYCFLFLSLIKLKECPSSSLLFFPLPILTALGTRTHLSSLHPGSLGLFTPPPPSDLKLSPWSHPTVHLLFMALHPFLIPLQVVFPLASIYFLSLQATVTCHLGRVFPSLDRLHPHPLIYSPHSISVKPWCLCFTFQWIPL